MAKNKNNPSGLSSRSMLGQKIGSMLDQKTNEDFNNEHPDHDGSNLINGNLKSNDKNNAATNKKNADKMNSSK